MSWDKCADCGANVNTDNDPGSYIEVGNMRRMTWTICVCEPCREIRRTREEAEADVAARAEAYAEQASQQ